jgi:hypothetical protein
MILQVCLSLYASRVETIESGVVVPLKFNIMGEVQ